MVPLCLLTAFVTAGCVVPVNIEPAPPQPNTRPTIIGGEPEFTMPVPLKHDQAISFSVQAFDPDAGDTIKAKLRRTYPSPVWLGEYIMKPSGEDGTTRTVTTEPHQYCVEWDPNNMAPANTTYYVAVYVSDLDFPNNLEPPSPDHSDFKLWPLLCQ